MSGPRCPKCDSYKPHLHPSISYDGRGEHVEDFNVKGATCDDAYHRRVSVENPPSKIRERFGPEIDVKAKLVVNGVDVWIDLNDGMLFCDLVERGLDAIADPVGFVGKYPVRPLGEWEIRREGGELLPSRSPIELTPLEWLYVVRAYRDVAPKVAAPTIPAITREQAHAVFMAGFEASGEGFNAEFMTQKAVKDRALEGAFEEWWTSTIESPPSTTPPTGDEFEDLKNCAVCHWPIPQCQCRKIVSQPPPIAQPDRPAVWDLVISDFDELAKQAHHGWETLPWESPALVLEDMRERDKVGRERYGVPLTSHNGRDHLIDAYEELLDHVVYLRAWLDEHTEDLLHTIKNHYIAQLRALWVLRWQIAEGK